MTSWQYGEIRPKYALRTLKVWDGYEKVENNGILITPSVHVISMN